MNQLLTANTLQCRKKPERLEIIILALATLVLFVYNAWPIMNYYTFTILADEFGYWANAAHFAGIVWPSTEYNLAYYSFGYSFLITPLFLLVKSPIVMYRIALLVNVSLICGCFWISYIFSKKIVSQVNKYILIALSFLTSLYPAYAVQSKIAWSECLLFLLFWILTLCFFIFSDKPTISMSIIISFILVYTYTVHQRSLGILISGIIIMLLLRFVNKTNNKHLFVFAIGIIGFLFLAYIIKSDLYNTVYSGNVNGTNDFSGQFNNMKNLLNVKGVCSIFVSLCGQIYYLGAATFLLFYYGLWEIIGKIIRVVRNRNRNEEFNWVHVFLFLSILGTLGISVIFMAQGTRSDHLFYGRYNEIIVGPIILIGLISLFRETNKRKSAVVFLISGLLQLILSLFVKYHLTRHSMTETNFVNVTGLYRAPGPHNSYNTLYDFIFCVICAGFILLICTILYKNIIAKSLGILSVIGAFIFLAYQYIPTSELTSQNYSKYEEISNYVNLDENCEIPTFYMSRGKSRAHIQLFMKERPLLFIHPTRIKELPSENIILISDFNLETGTFYLQEKYNLQDIILENIVWKTREVTNEKYDASQIVLPINVLKTQNGIYEQPANALTSNGEQGYLAFGPHVPIDAGTYLCEFEITLLENTQYNIGNVDIANSGNPITIKNITADDFNDNHTACFIVPFACNSPLPQIEFRVFTTEGTVMQLNTISIELIDEDPTMTYDMSIFGTQNGLPSDNSIISTGDPGYLIFGNYTELPAGWYKYDMTLRLPDGAPGKAAVLDVAYNQGADIIDQCDISGDMFNRGALVISRTFRLNGNASDLETRVFTEQGVILEVSDVKITKLDELQYEISDFATQNGRLENGALVSNQDKGYLLYGNYVDIPRGCYEAQIDMELSDDSFGSVIVDVVSQQGLVTHDVKTLTEGMFENGKLSLSLPFMIFQKEEDVEIRLFTDGTQISVQGVNIVDTNSIVYGLGSFASQNGLYDDVNSTVISNGEAGFLLYGNYRNRQPGKYLYQISLDIIEHNSKSADDIVVVDVVYNSGKDELFSETIHAGTFENGHLLLDFPLDLDKQIGDVELRVYVENGAKIRVNKIVEIIG